MPDSSSTRPYRKKHVIDTVINDESCRNGREITIHVDSLGMMNIAFGNSMTIRTDADGLRELQSCISRAESELLSIRTVEENTCGWPC